MLHFGLENRFTMKHSVVFMANLTWIEDPWGHWLIPPRIQPQVICLGTYVKYVLYIHVWTLHTLHTAITYHIEHGIHGFTWIWRLKLVQSSFVSRRASGSRERWKMQNIHSDLEWTSCSFLSMCKTCWGHSSNEQENYHIWTFKSNPDPSHFTF